MISIGGVLITQNGKRVENYDEEKLTSHLKGAEILLQVDLGEGTPSGLVEAERALAAVEGVRFVRFAPGDVVRHPVVGEIIDAYEKHRMGRKRRPDGERGVSG